MRIEVRIEVFVPDGQVSRVSKVELARVIGGAHDLVVLDLLAGDATYGSARAVLREVLGLVATLLNSSVIVLELLASSAKVCRGAMRVTGCCDIDGVDLRCHLLGIHRVAHEQRRLSQSLDFDRLHASEDQAWRLLGERS
jgi:hypothetical protein